MRELEGRRLWFVGIGGAGMSALALVARAWGAEVAGWDRHETPYLTVLDSVEVVISHEPGRSPAGSGRRSCRRRMPAPVPGRSRGELLAEIVGLRPSIVVAGAHGKTTTAAMIAFCLDRLGLDPTFLVGGRFRSSVGTRAWRRLARGGRRRVGSVARAAAARDRGADERRSRPPRDVRFARRGRGSLRALARGCGSAVRGDELAPLEYRAGVPGGTTGGTRRAPSPRSSSPACRGRTCSACSGEFAGAGRRFEHHGEADGVDVYDDYAHHPAEIDATLAAAREALPDRRLLVLFQPHLYSRTRYLADEFADADRRRLRVRDRLYGAREQPVTGVSGKLVVDRLAALRPGASVGWAPELDAAAALFARRARRGDVVLTSGRAMSTEQRR